MTEEQIQNTISNHRSRNLHLRQVLLEKAVSLGEARPSDVHFWAAHQKDAALLARELYGRGYLVTVIAHTSDPDEERWNVEAGARIIPQNALSDEFTEDLVQLAAAYGSMYDGWGTSI
jgi:Regulator of ribonuclease activity B